MKITSTCFQLSNFDAYLQMRLAELLEEEGADIIQTEGGKCSSPTKPGVLGLIEKVWQTWTKKWACYIKLFLHCTGFTKLSYNWQATPTLAAAYSISRAVSIPVMCSSGLSSMTAPMAVTAGAAGVVCTNVYLKFFSFRKNQRCDFDSSRSLFFWLQGVGSSVNKLNDVVAMIAEVRSIAQAMGLDSRNVSENLRTVHH